MKIVTKIFSDSRNLYGVSFRKTCATWAHGWIKIFPPHIQHLNDISLKKTKEISNEFIHLFVCYLQVFSTPNFNSFIVHSQFFKIKSINCVKTTSHCRRTKKNKKNEDFLLKFGFSLNQTERVRLFETIDFRFSTIERSFSNWKYRKYPLHHVTIEMHPKWEHQWSDKQLFF